MTHDEDPMGDWQNGLGKPGATINRPSVMSAGEKPPGLLSWLYLVFLVAVALAAAWAVIG